MALRRNPTGNVVRSPKAKKKGYDPRDKASVYHYADSVYEAALDKVGKKLNMRARLDAAMKAAEKFLRRQGIKLSRDDVAKYYKRTGRHAPVPLTAEQQAEREKESRAMAARHLKETLERLGDIRDAGTVLFGKLDAGAFDHAAIGMFIESAIDRVGRDLEGMFPGLGLELKKDERRFLEE